ncbi:M3 family metallopeptidase [Bradyrhizobium sp. vgs-9]|uniref:M3 family metallopeptidase n=1 Tax=Bradyrhizobium sp. vgs-9 TaxID=208389 RepID=UPI0035D47C22
MSNGVLAKAAQPRLVEIDLELAAMLDRVRTIAMGEVLGDAEFGELVAIYNNLSYLFLYLESNSAHVDWRPVAHWKPAFYADAVLNAALTHRLSKARFDDCSAERVRAAYLEFFDAKAKGSGNEDQGEREAALDQAHRVLAQLEVDQSELLARLGASGGGPPAVRFYNLISTVRSATTRAKLSKTWSLLRDRRAPALEAAVDRLVGLRRERSRGRGFKHPLAESLQRSHLNAEQVEAFIADYLRRALQAQEQLDREVAERLGLADEPMQHFEYFVRQVQDGARIPLFQLDRCLEFAFDVAKAAFGLEFVRAPRTSAHVIRVDVRQQGRPCGMINFDLWDQLLAPKAANTTLSLRNRMDWAGRLQLPIAYVSCRFKRRDEQGSAITFQNVHSLFHEFGHAINHILISRVLPSESGLEYLPLERLETLSMWFERWVFHPRFAASVAPSTPQVLASIAVAQAIKRLEYRRTHVDRAVTAALDFEVGRSDASVREAFASLDDRFGISRQCAVEEFLGSFTLPMLEANSGGYFAYLWGAADSAEKFAPWRSDAPGTWPSEDNARQMFAGCFDFDAPSAAPAAESAFAFYDHNKAA